MPFFTHLPILDHKTMSMHPTVAVKATVIRPTIFSLSDSKKNAINVVIIGDVI